MSEAKTYAAGDMTLAEAQDITRAIRSRCDEIWDLLVVAYQRRADKAMGYESWDSYCETEFRMARIALPAEERAAVAVSLRAQGLSTRAIASATGVSNATVSRDQATAVTDVITDVIQGQAVSAHPAGVGETVTGLDGREHPASQPRTRQPRARNEPYAVGDRPAASPGWGMLVTALMTFINDPAPVSELTTRQRRSIAAGFARVEQLMSDT
jgi:hypothetical protein